MPKSLDAILEGAAKELEERFEEVQAKLAPLRDEEREIAEALHRLTGSYPTGFRPGLKTSATVTRGSRSRSNLSADEREQRILQLVNSAGNEGVTGKQVAEEIGVSPATAAKSVNDLIDAGKIKSQGERRSRRLMPA